MGAKVHGRRQRERDLVRQAILTAAHDLIRIEGCRRVSMRRIARRVEYSAAAIYSYFPCRDAILATLVEEGWCILAASLDAVPRHSEPLERLRERLWRLYEFSTAQPEYFGLMFLEQPLYPVSERCGRSMAEATAGAESDIRACIATRHMPECIDPSAAVRLLWAGMIGASAVGRVRLSDSDDEGDAVAHDVLNVLLAGLTTAALRNVGCRRPRGIDSR